MQEKRLAQNKSRFGGLQIFIIQLEAAKAAAVSA